MCTLPGLPRHLSLLRQHPRQTQTGMMLQLNPFTSHLVKCKLKVTLICPCISQVGNAVPPPLSKAIGLEIKRCVQERIKENAAGVFIYFSCSSTSHYNKFLISCSTFFSLRACKKGEDGGLKLKPSHKTAGHLHCVWECVCDASAH